MGGPTAAPVHRRRRCVRQIDVDAAMQRAAPSELVGAPMRTGQRSGGGGGGGSSGGGGGGGWRRATPADSLARPSLRLSLLSLSLLLTQVAAPEVVRNGTTTLDLPPSARRVSKCGGSELVHEIEWRVPVGCEYEAVCPRLSHRICSAAPPCCLSQLTVPRPPVWTASAASS
jgi:hypothetical protein